MKYFTIIVFLFLSTFAFSQLNMEEVSYVPSPSGYYNSLIVKGDVYINKLRSNTSFDVISYSSFLDMEVLPPSSSQISILQISTGTLVVDNYVDPNTITINLRGGSVSFYPSNYGSTVRIGNTTLQDITSPNVFNIHAQTVTFKGNNENRNANFLYLMGMRVPPYLTVDGCEQSYYWQSLKVGNTSYSVLACRTLTCSSYATEESCLQQGKYWCITNGPNSTQTCTCQSSPCEQS